MMDKAALRRMILGGMAALLFAQLLYGALTLSALYKQYQESVFQINAVLCENIANHLSLQVRVGKALRRSTVERYLGNYRDIVDIGRIIVTDAGQRAIYAPDAEIAAHIPPRSEQKPLLDQLRKASTSGFFWIAGPVADRSGTESGTVYIALDKEELFAQVLDSAKRLLFLFLAITIGECLLLPFFLHRFAVRKGPGRPTPSRMRMQACFIAPLLIGHLLFLGLLIHPLSQLYQSELTNTGHHVVRQTAGELDRIVGLGLPVSRIHTIDEWLTSRLKLVDGLGMAVYDETGKFHSAAGKQGSLQAAEWQTIADSTMTARQPLRHPVTGTPAGEVRIAMDGDTVGANLLSVMLDNATLTLVAALFLAELVLLLQMSAPLAGPRTFFTEAIHPVVFACLFATELSMSYVPIRIGELGLDLFSLPPDVVSGLPVSSELFMAGAAMLIGGFWSQRSGWRPMLLWGISLSCMGAILSWTSSSPLPFILARGFSGLGYGFINLSAQVYVISHSSEKTRARDLAFMFGGLYSGTLCGSSMGGLLADRLGYHAVFPATAVLLVALLVILARLLPQECWIQEKRQEGFSRSEALCFLKDRRMGSLLLFFIVPNALITVCLFQFFIPLSLSQSGTPPAAIGRVFLLYCVIVMFAGPYFGSLIDRSKKMAYPLFLSMVIATASVFSLVLFEGLAAAMLCVSLLAVNTAIASNGQGAYALSLPASLRFGRSRTMGFYNVAMRIGQVLGPLSLGMMITIWDTKTGLTILGLFTIVCAVSFLATSAAPKSQDC